MAVVVAVAGALSACATSNVGVARSSNLVQPRLMASNGPATPPAGFLDFCARSPQDCGLQADAAADAAAPAVASSYAYAPAAAPRAPRGGYDWSGAFAASRPSQDSDQVAALRQQLYSRYMWKAAFAAAAPQAPAASAPAPAIEAPSLQPAVMQEASPSPFAAPQSYLIKASYSWVADTSVWNQLESDDVVAPSAVAAFEQAPSVTDPEQALPAVAQAPAVQPLAVTKALMTEIVAIDRRINRRIVQTEDVRLYGQDDYWTLPIEGADAVSAKGLVRGDCEDYALEKRRALIAAGVPAEALAIAVADTRFGPHAVLLVDTDKGELVLDSLSGKVVAWNRTGYRWIKRQAWGDPMSWVEIAQNN